MKTIFTYIIVFSARSDITVSITHWEFDTEYVDSDDEGIRLNLQL